MTGKCCKYVNNNGFPEKSDPGDKDLYDKAEVVSRFSLADSGGKLLLLDLKGVGHNGQFPLGGNVYVEYRASDDAITILLRLVYSEGVKCNQCEINQIWLPSMEEDYCY